MGSVLLQSALTSLQTAARQPRPLLIFFQMSTSIIGTKFVLAKACPTYDTKPGMFAVIAKYEKNVVKDRMEAVVAVFGDEALADKYASNLKALAADANALDADGGRAAHLALLAQAVGGSAFAGLSHGSLASIYKDWRVVFKEPVALPVDAAVAAAAAAKAARVAASAAKVGTTVRARLAFEDVNGLMRAESVEALLERVQYRPPGSEAASFIVSFTVEGEMYEVAYLEASLDACVAAAEPAPPPLPPVVVIGAEYSKTLAVLGRVSRSATLLAAEPQKVCSAELQQLAEALAVPGGARPFTHVGMGMLSQAGAHAMFAESQLLALEAGATSGVTVSAAAAGIPAASPAHSVVPSLCQALGLPVSGRTIGSGAQLTGGGGSGALAGVGAAPPPLGISSTPRVDALEGKSIPGEFQVFLSDVIPWVAPSSRVAALAKFPDLARAELERWLKAQGPRADPALLRGAAGAALCSASDLLKICVVFGEGGQAVANPTHPSGGVGLGNGVSPFLITAPDTSGSEAEQRERTALREDAVLLIGDPAARGRLTAMAKTMALDPPLLWKSATEEASEPLRRLLFSGDEVRQALAGQVAPDLESDLSCVRGALDRRLEKAVLFSEADTISSRASAALRWVRLGRLGKVRLLHLLDLDDTSTDDDPLLGLKSAAGNGLATLGRAFSRLGLAWSMAWPPHSSMAISFLSRLLEKITELRQEMAVPWTVISTYYRSLFKKVDSGARRFAIREEHQQFRTAPSLDWVDGQFEYVRVVDRMANADALTSLRNEFRTQVASLQLEIAEAPAPSSDPSKAAKQLEKKIKKKQKAKAKKAVVAAAKGKTPPVGGQDGGEPTKLLAIKDHTGRQKIEAEVAAKHPAINGRKACPFHFGPKGACDYDATTCIVWPHG